MITIDNFVKIVHKHNESILTKHDRIDQQITDQCVFVAAFDANLWLLLWATFLDL